MSVVIVENGDRIVRSDTGRRGVKETVIVVFSMRENEKKRGKETEIKKEKEKRKEKGTETATEEIQEKEMSVPGEKGRETQIVIVEGSENGNVTEIVNIKETQGSEMNVLGGKEKGNAKMIVNGAKETTEEVVVAVKMITNARDVEHPCLPICTIFY